MSMTKIDNEIELEEEQKILVVEKYSRFLWFIVTSIESSDLFK